MSRLRALAVAVATACLLMAGGTAAAAAPVDQASETNEGVSGFCTLTLGQQFIANASGRLARIDLLVNRSTIGDPGDLVVSLIRSPEDLDEDDWTGEVLATETLAAADVAPGPGIGWSTVWFDPAPTMTAGAWYLITLDAPDCTPPGDSGFGWAVGFADPYARGVAFSSDDTDGPWTVDDDQDRAFRTYVRRASRFDQPDLELSRSASGPWIGGNLYDLDGWTERIELAIEPGEQMTFWVRAGNDGTRDVRLKVRSVASHDGFRVRYLAGRQGATDITKAVVAGTYRIGPIQPGARRILRVVITAKPGVATGAVLGVAPRARSVAQPSHGDALRIRLTVD